MAILKIRDKDGNVQEILVIRGEDGKDYVLTEKDKQEIAAMISASAVAPVAIDTSDFALKSDIPDVSGFALKTEIPDVSGFALKTEIPDVSGYTTMSAVEAEGYKTEAQVQALITTAIANLPTEAWTFTLEDGSTVTKTVVLK